MMQSKNAYPVNSTLTPEQRRFRGMLSKYPNLQPFWNFETCECDINTLHMHLDSLSYDEREIARFFVTMWQPGNLLEFDIMEAIWKMSDGHWRVIEQWMATLERPDVTHRMMRNGQTHERPYAQ